ncbi:MFS transporter [Herbaspirillum autotrophicum]|uniref:MFS transporter n=1 Tax=Herbaspirillum autotrophicum TaxID=180195 RepID=UPI00067C3D60|nr:MFS transporter [Herbaspirillum autotrophicum]
MSAVKKPNRVIVFLSSFIGTALEQYDFLLYGTAAALVFNKLFFPTLDPLTGALAAIATYATGYVGRPLGSILCGYLGDRYGRKSVLLATLIIMGVASTLIGLLPTYASVGIWAPVMLCTLRLIQGIALGGEQGGAILIAVENAPQKRKGLFGSWSSAGGMAGLVMSTLALSITAKLPEADFLSWGWRLPFLFSIVLVVIGVISRARLPESEDFAAARQAGTVSKTPLRALVREHKKEILLAAVARAGEIAWVINVLVFTTSYVVTQLQLGKPMILNAILIGACISIFGNPFFAAISDRIGFRRMYLIGAGVAAIGIWPYFAMVSSAQPLLVCTAVILAIGVVHPMMYGPQGALFASLFGTKVRYSGVGISHQIGALVGGGLTPLLSALLLAKNQGSPWMVAILITAFSLIAGIAVMAMGKAAVDDSSPARNGEATVS